ncbi:MAG: ribonuclease HI family protein [Methanobacteriota archaeon]
MEPEAVLEFDGACSGNPGPMGIGVVLRIPGARPVEVGEGLVGTGTNNIAEYSALVRGLRLAAERGVRRLLVRGDSQLVIRQMNGEWRVNDARLAELHEEATALSRAFEQVRYEWVPRERNTRANELSVRPLEDARGDAALLAKIRGEAPKADVSCPRCGKPGEVRERTFKDGTKHHELRCAEHGHIRFLPR